MKCFIPLFTCFLSKKKCTHGILELIVAMFIAWGNEDTIRIGNIKVYVPEQVLYIPAKIAIESGLLEYFAVTPGGKTYESVVTLLCDPKNLHSTILLINAKPGKVVFPTNPRGDVQVSGDTLDISIMYNSNDTVTTISALDLITFRDQSLVHLEKTKKKQMFWIFTGSCDVYPTGFRDKPAHGSSLSGTLISIIQDATAEINLNTQTKNPYQNEKYGFTVSTKLMKKLGETFWVVIKKAQKIDQ